MELVTTGEKWIGYGIQTINSKIVELLSFAQNEIVLSIFIITDDGILNLIKESLEKGIEVVLYCFKNVEFSNQFIIDELKKYALEYASNEIEMHKDTIKPGERVVIIDDVLATGGTMQATCEIVEKLGGKIVGIGFLIDLKFLKGSEKLKKYRIVSILEYE